MEAIDKICHEILYIVDAHATTNDEVLTTSYYQKIVLMQTELVRALLVEPIDIITKEMSNTIEDKKNMWDDINDDEIRIVKG